MISAFVRAPKLDGRLTVTEETVKRLWFLVHSASWCLQALSEFLKKEEMVQMALKRKLMLHLPQY